MKCLTKGCKTRSLLMTVELCYPCSQLVEKGKREWVGLTDEEIAEAVGNRSLNETYLRYFRKVIAKLKEKNNG